MASADGLAAFGYVTLAGWHGRSLGPAQVYVVGSARPLPTMRRVADEHGEDERQLASVAMTAQLFAQVDELLDLAVKRRAKQ